MKVKYLFVVVLTTLALLLSACGGGGQPAATTEEPSSSGGAPEPAAPEPTEPAEPAILQTGWAGSPDTLNPGTAVLAEAYTLFELVYDSMYQLNLDGT